MIGPQCKLIGYPLGYFGVVEKFGLSMDYPVSVGAWTERDHTWRSNDFGPRAPYRQHVTNYTSLKCVTPVPWASRCRHNPEPTQLSDWLAMGNGAFRDVTTSVGNWRASIEYYDGSAYTLSSLNTRGELYSRNPRRNSWFYVAHRHAPPPQQLVRMYTALRMDAEVYVDGEWAPAYYTVVIPFKQDDLARPFIHVITVEAQGEIEDSGRAVDYLVDGAIVSECPEDPQGAEANGVSFIALRHELFDDRRYFPGTHVLMGGFAGASILGAERVWEWHFYDPNFRVKPSGQQGLLQQGYITKFVWPQVYYGVYRDDMFTEPDEARIAPVRAVDLPPASTEWNDENKYGLIYTPADGWVVRIEQEGHTAATSSDCPLIIMESHPEQVPDCINNRPVIWRAWSERSAVVTAINTEDSPVDSDGLGVLVATQYTQRDGWRGSSGRAAFKFGDDFDTYPWSVANSQVDLYMGWEDDEATPALRMQQVATAFVRGGDPRTRDGQVYGGLVVPEIQLEDFVQNVVSTKDVIDVRMAAGQTVGPWFRECGARLGLTEDRIDVDSHVEDLEIPVASPVPSAERFLAEEGSTSWADYLDSVLQPMKLRWGWDKDGTGKLFVDAGAETYEDGVSSIGLTIAHDTLVDSEVLFRFSHSSDTTMYRNCLKLRYGSLSEDLAADSTKRLGAYVVYNVEAFADRQRLGVDRWMSVEPGPQAYGVESEVERIIKDVQKYKDIILWEGHLLPALRVDDFVQVYSAPGTGVAENEVYQIYEHTLVTDNRPAESVAESRVFAKWVYTPEA